MPAKKKPATPKTVAAHTYRDATRKNIPSAEMQPVVDDSVKSPVQVAYERRNPDLDPQFVWRGKSDEALQIAAPPLYIQEKVHPKVLIDDLLRQSKKNAVDAGDETPDLFADFNGLPKHAKSTDFYQHDGHWSNRMILGDSLQVMASLAEREGLRGKVQCIYFDPPLRHQVQLQLPVVHHQPRREGRQKRPHHPRARAGQSLPRHLARRHPQLPYLPARSADRRP